MRQGFEINAKQEQRPFISQELKQSLKILQFSSQELGEYLRTEMESNPLLEINDNCKMQIEYENQPAVDNLPFDWKEYFESASSNNYAYDKNEIAYQDDEKAPAYEMIPEGGISLYEHLMLQMEMADVNDVDRRIISYLIKCIDDNGYLTISKREAEKILNVDRDKVSECLKLIQSFDPPGVGARSLRECLIIQLKQINKLTPEIKAIVLEHLKDIAANNYAAISRKQGISISKIEKICELIRSLEPKPGRSFASSNEVKYIMPDIVVEKAGDDYIVNINDICTPRLRINNVYQSMLNRANMDPDVIQFILNRMKSAYFVIRAIEQRRLTIMKVAESIVSRQADFFEKGISYLKPLTLKIISEDTDLHESTVSRAIKNKYIQTPSGVYDLKIFFDSGISDSSGNQTASHTIKQMIIDLIAHEDPLNPYSDFELTDILTKNGYDISRRTVAKYREQLNIDNSVKRKNF